MDALNIGLFNDSFPPTIDGVANAVVNYAHFINQNHGTSIVATPWYPNTVDEYPFDVIRYPSAYINKKLGYRAGYPFDPLVIKKLENCKIDLIHTHCPFISTVLARVLRFQIGAPIIFTYHTKFDIDIESRVASNPVRSASIKFILSNINACDEIWTVSKGAGENLQGLGFQRDYVVMDNGTDFPRGHASNADKAALCAQHGISEELPVFLFVGRMMWYKGVRLSIDGLRLAMEQGMQFHMIFVGEGLDRPEIAEYVKACGLEGCCTFTGAIRDREILRTYFSLADLFLFPSTYDTNGLVVKEAAACDCPSVLIRGSCAAEGVVHGETGLIIEPTPESMAEMIALACKNRPFLVEIGIRAGETLYLSWEDAIARAYQRYGIVLENYEKRLDAPPANEIFFDNVQHVGSDLMYRARRNTRRLHLTYQCYSKRVKTTLYGTGKHVKRLFPQKRRKLKGLILPEKFLSNKLREEEKTSN